jgi:tetratricopeptide (TPR) repeat protein
VDERVIALNANIQHPTSNVQHRSAIGPSSFDVRCSFSILSALLALFATSCARESPFPPLPENIQHEKLRASLSEAHAAASEDPDRGSAVGELAMRYHANLFYDRATTCYLRAIELEPINPRWAYYLGALQQSIGDNARVAQLMASVEQNGGTYLPARMRLADAHFKRAKPLQAKQLYDQCRTDPNVAPYADLALARIAMSDEDWPSAAGHLDSALQVIPDFGEALDSAATVQDRLGNAEQAKAFRTRAIDARRGLTPPDPWMDQLWERCLDVDYLLILADTAVSAQEGMKASRLYQLAVRAAPGSAQPKLGFARALIKRKQNREALPLLREARALEPDNPEVLWNLASVLTRLGQVDEAQVHGRRAAAIAPGDAEVQLTLGVMKLGRDNKEGALAAFHEAIRIDPDLVRARLNIGHVMMMLQRHDEAIPHYQRAIAIAPTEDEAWLGTATVLVKTGKPEAALPYYRETIRLNPDEAANHFELGAALMELGRRDEAIAAYREALRLNPGYNLAIANLGAELDRRGQLDQAIALYRRGIEAKPNAVFLHNNLGFALSRQGKWNEAIAAYRRALETDPDHPQAKVNLQMALEKSGDTHP